MFTIALHYDEYLSAFLPKFFIALGDQMHIISAYSASDISQYPEHSLTAKNGKRIKFVSQMCIESEIGKTLSHRQFSHYDLLFDK